MTQQCRLPAEECRRRFAQAGGPLAPVADFAEVWFRHAPQITFHDPLAAALLFEPSLCRLEAHRVEVELVSPHRLGQTFPEWHDRHGSEAPVDTPPHQLAASVDAEAFFDHYFGVVGG